MLRIRRVTDRSPVQPMLRVEGRIVSDWVGVLERECQLAFEGKRRVALDLSAVTFIDQRGVAALKRLSADALELINCPEFIEELLR
jgi:anti-anti-sigma regulatory factor